MNLMLVLLGTLCLFLEGIHSQGFINSRNHMLTQHNPFRRQINVGQPQQSSHHYNGQFGQQQQQQQQLHQHQQPKKQSQYIVQQSPSIEIPLNHQHQLHKSVITQRSPSYQQQQQAAVRFSQNSGNNFRQQNSGQQQQQQSLTQQQTQHHTQTNFIPNFAQSASLSINSPQPHNVQHQRSVQNQLQVQQSPFQVQQQQQQRPNDFSAPIREQYVQQVGPQQALPDRVQNSQFQQNPSQQFASIIPQFQSPPTLQPAGQFQSNGSPQQKNQQPQQQQVFVTTFPQQQKLTQVQQQQYFTLPQNQYVQQPIQPFSTAPQFPNLVDQQQRLPQVQQNNQFRGQSSQFQSYQGQQQQREPQLPIPPQINPNILFTGSQQAQGPQFQTIISPIPKQSVDNDVKQKLIQKHEQFVQEQYEKQQTKVKQLHDKFMQKQEAIKSIGLTKGPLFDQTTPTSRGRPIIHPSESQLFNLAVQKYNQDHPTTTTTTTTTTTSEKPKDNPFDQLLQAQRKDIYSSLKLESDRAKLSKTSKTGKPLGRDELLRQLKQALADSPQPDLGNKTFDSHDIVLPNGERVQVIRTSDPNVVRQQQLKQQQQQQQQQQQKLQQLILSQQNANTAAASTTDQKYSFPAGLQAVAPKHKQDLVLPNGHKVEIIRTPDPQSTGLQALPSGVDLSSLASLYGGSAAKTASNDDGSGLASSAVITSDSDEPPTFEELAKRGLIPEGYEIQGLPGPKSKPIAASPPAAKKKATYVYLEEQSDGSFKIQGVKANGEKESKTSGSEVDSILERIKSGDIKLPPTVKKLHLPSEEQIVQTPTPIQPTTFAPKLILTTTTTAPESIRLTSTVSPYSTIVPLVHRSSAGHQTTHNHHQTTSSPSHPPQHQIFSSSTHHPITERLTATTEQSDHILKSSNPGEDLIKVLRLNGLYAMSKYLKQSGLDSILNETGPYTIFVPTDKAFKSLLIQLGGPERAEEKFKANPRLLSGLLLHHVIPGSFEVSALQDEMTGVSLAGTQLRVNQYTMHDQEWNDVLITTINGAMIVNDKRDIKIPQGIAHGVDRVMFPLPVGDLLQTLQSDRENRFTKFLKILYASGMSEKLQNKGTKTYTVFAPTDKAFNELESDALEKLLNDKELAETFAMKHVVTGTLFSAGMRFYQVKDSLLDGKTITLQKTSAGQIKVNEANMITSNIPATNGVIHALNGLL